jgi:glycosidase
MRFWFRRGVDGFRVDVLWHLIKDDACRDNPSNPLFHAGEPPHHALVPLYTADRPEVHGVIAEMRRVTDEFSDRVLIGEIYLPLERLVAYYGRDLAGVHLPFNFSLLSAIWDAPSIAGLIGEYEAALPAGGWPNWVLGNHDWPRIASRVGPYQARIAAMLLLTLRGTPTIYYGDEIAMTQVEIAPEQVVDPLEANIPGRGLGRDGCRTPMQWDATINGGFTTAKPWLPLGRWLDRNNAARQRREQTSMYQLYRRLIDLRRNRGALLFGRYERVLADGTLLVFTREFEGERMGRAVAPVHVRRSRRRDSARQHRAARARGRGFGGSDPPLSMPPVRLRLCRPFPEWARMPPSHSREVNYSELSAVRDAPTVAVFQALQFCPLFSNCTTVSMSLTGSCFSTESAPRPFHHGIRERGGTIFWATLPSDER